MRCLRVATGCWVAAAGAMGGNAPGATADSPAALLSPDLRAQARTIERLRDALLHLPDEPGDETTDRIGWHSGFAQTAAAPKSVVVDLGTVQEFEAVVLVPVNMPHGNDRAPGYGFPRRFRVESFDDSASPLPSTLGDFTAAEFPSPGNLPVVIETPEAKGRFVRITATELYRHGGRALFSLGELMVLSGDRNLAAGSSVQGSDQYANLPAWDWMNLTDSQSVVGPPVESMTPPGHGYHSAIAREESDLRWVQADLGEAMPLDEVRLYPARPADFPPRRGFGFPRRFRVEAGRTPEFSEPVVLLDSTAADFLNPGENPVVIPSRGTIARHIRVTATRLWRRDHDFVFALGELEAYSAGRNVAAGAPVTALDNLEISNWRASALTDGFTSRGKLVPQSQWLRGLSRRREILAELTLRNAAYEAQTAIVWRRTAWTAAAAVPVLAGGLWLLALRRKRRHRQEINRLQRRIASDLHDEIGSNLGSISLLANLAAGHDPDSARADLLEIHRIAQETAESMRDIVWLIQPGAREPADLVARMRETAAGLLAGIEWEFRCGGVTGPFSLEFERQVYLLFREALNNIRKHARAGRVRIRAGQCGSEFFLTITDNGTGFEASSPARGNGISNMRHRAELLGGRLSLHSRPSRGTRLNLRTSLT